jgi:triosephosphate isomerase
MAGIGVVAQNFDIFDGDGLDPFARTGSISPSHLHVAGAQGVILGHSEVGDSPQTTNKKLLSILKRQQELKSPFFLNRITILVGESWKEFEGSSLRETAMLVKAKCSTIFDGIPKQLLSQVVVGYEPKWGSRGSGRDDMPPPEPKLISMCIQEMRAFFGEKYGNEIKPCFVYGGRSTPERAKEILADKEISGLILGSACNTVEKTMAIARAMRNICGERKKVLICNFKAFELCEPYEKYISGLGKLPADFTVLLAPPYTDIRLARSKIEAAGLLLPQH